MIILYDSRLTPLQAANPTTWKARFILNYKNLPYKTEWTPYHDIASVYHKHNLQPVCSRTDPSTGKAEPYYTIPVIFDDSTGRAIADSLEIAKYLDETYPDTPKVVPETGEDGVDAKQQVDQFMGVIFGALGPSNMSRRRVNPSSRKRGRRTLVRGLGTRNPSSTYSP
ncbi:hypothetical protein CC2G_009870 [Coprinopsis cinerea AmutBmut pab1-1]|nr:hypothetical protein CC2G_009870 [Coprinopsis cinerea AmutBmut pab1-1]